MDVPTIFTYLSVRDAFVLDEVVCKGSCEKIFVQTALARTEELQQVCAETVDVAVSADEGKRRPTRIRARPQVPSVSCKRYAGRCHRTDGFNAESRTVNTSKSDRSRRLALPLLKARSCCDLL